MALPMVHLAAAYKWAADKERLFTSPEYYLGAISPDAIHSRPDTHRDDKNKVHLHFNISDVVSDFTSHHNDPFGIGYAIHIITDRIWVNYYHDNFPDLFDEHGKTIPSRYYNDTDQVDYLLYDRLPYRGYLFDMLEKAISPTLDNMLTSDEIEAWKQRTLHWFEKGSQWKDPIRYLTYDRICDFIESAPEKIKEAFNFNENIIYQ